MPDYRETIRAIEDAMHEAQERQQWDEWRRLESKRHETWMKARGLWVEPPPQYEQGMLLEAQ